MKRNIEEVHSDDSSDYSDSSESEDSQSFVVGDNVIIVDDELPVVIDVVDDGLPVVVPKPVNVEIPAETPAEAEKKPAKRGKMSTIKMLSISGTGHHLVTNDSVTSAIPMIVIQTGDRLNIKSVPDTYGAGNNNNNSCTVINGCVVNGVNYTGSNFINNGMRLIINGVEYTKNMMTGAPPSLNKKEDEGEKVWKLPTGTTFDLDSIWVNGAVNLDLDVSSECLNKNMKLNASGASKLLFSGEKTLDSVACISSGAASIKCNRLVVKNGKFDASGASKITDVKCTDSAICGASGAAWITVKVLKGTKKDSSCSGCSTVKFVSE